MACGYWASVSFDRCERPMSSLPPPQMRRRTFSSPTKVLCNSRKLFPAAASPFPPHHRPRQSLIHFLFPQINFTFPPFHKNGTILCVLFCVWFLLHSVIFLRFIHVGMCICSLFFLCWILCILVFFLVLIENLPEKGCIGGKC